MKERGEDGNPVASGSAHENRERIARWVIPALFAGLAVSYLITENHLLALAAALASSSLIALATLRISAGAGPTSLHIGTWLPIAAPLVLARLNEEPTFWSRSVPLLLVAVVLGFLVTCGIDLRPVVARFGHLVASVLRSLAAAVVFVVILMPMGIARLWRRKDPLGTGKGDEKDSAWHEITSLPSFPLKPFRVEKTTHMNTVDTLTASVTQAVGAVVLLLCLDLGLGSAAVRIFDDEVPVPTAVYDQVGIGRRSAVDQPRDPRIDLPALSDSPWAEEWFKEFNSVDWYYWPYLQYRIGDFEGEYLNIRDGKRRSFQSELADRSDAVEVGFFGGSTAFGMAQRDEHTIPSELARLADEAGIPIAIRNYGVSGYTNWQELVLFEQVSAGGDAPDLAVFYDGANELSAQIEGISGVPSHTGLKDTADLLGAPNELTPAPVPEYDEVTSDDIWKTYRDKSLMRRLVRGAIDLLSPEADASVVQDRGSYTVKQAEASVDVYRRGRSIILDLAQKYDVQPIFFWQPREIDPIESGVQDQIGSPTIDITGAFDEHPDVYIDSNHHNEKGSRIAAAAIWEQLEPVVRAEYENR